MDQQGDNAWPSQKTLATRSGLSERCVRRHLQIAARGGWLDVRDKQPKGKGWRLHEYGATVPAKAGGCLEEHPWEADSSWRRAERHAAPEGEERRASPNRVGAAEPVRAEAEAHPADSGADGAAAQAHRAASDDHIVRHQVPTTLPSDSSLTPSRTPTGRCADAHERTDFSKKSLRQRPDRKAAATETLANAERWAAEIQFRGIRPEESPESYSADVVRAAAAFRARAASP